MDPVRVFFCEPTEHGRVWLRRYVGGEGAKCAQSHTGYHGARAFVEDMLNADADKLRPEHFKDDARWPTACACGYAFKADDEFQILTRQLYRRVDSGDLAAWDDMPIGAVRDAAWLKEFHPEMIRADGRILECQVPAGYPSGKVAWLIDSQCSNCTRPGEPHECWVRHGRPEDGTLHVDKNGNTCNAGAGSIAVHGWHGFLHNGRLVTC